jgi:hypothetical protein
VQSKPESRIAIRCIADSVPESGGYRSPQEAIVNPPFREATVIPNTHTHAIAQLSRELHLPLSQVTEVYQAELAKLNESARLHHFVSVLPTRHARGILVRSRRQ